MKNSILSGAFFLTMLLVSCGNANEKRSKIEPKESLDSVVKPSNSDVKPSNSDSINNLEGVIIGKEEVMIGKQTWSTKNLDVTTFRNGDKIPEVKTDKEWLNADIENKPAWCYYNNDTANGKKYGKLYNWYAVHDKRGLAPKGWHIPNDEEWTILETFLGGGKEACIKMKSTWGWEEYKGKNGNGSNASGFAGLPGGSRLNYGPFNDIGVQGCWFTFTGCAVGPGLSNDNYFFQWMDGSPSEIGGGGFSVRCLRD